MQWVIKFEDTPVLGYHRTHAHTHHEWMDESNKCHKWRYSVRYRICVSRTSAQRPMRSRSSYNNMNNDAALLANCEGGCCRWTVLLQWQNDSPLNWMYSWLCCVYVCAPFAVATVEGRRGARARSMYLISSIHHRKFNRIMVTSLNWMNSR